MIYLGLFDIVLVQYNIVVMLQQVYREKRSGKMKKSKYLLLVHFKNGCESYYSNDPDKLKEYAEMKNYKSYEIFELNKTFYSYISSDK